MEGFARMIGEGVVSEMGTNVIDLSEEKWYSYFSNLSETFGTPIDETVDVFISDMAMGGVEFTKVA